MTNIDRAVRVLHESLDRIWGYDAPDWADDIAADLRDAGLLAPDLPQVTHRAGMGAAGTEYPMSSGRFARVNLQNSAEYLWAMFNPGSVTLIHNRGKRTDAKGRTWPDTTDMCLSPDAAREIALTLLAAADHAEGEV